jgi:hypothetical protein
VIGKEEGGMRASKEEELLFIGKSGRAHPYKGSDCQLTPPSEEPM